MPLFNQECIKGHVTSPELDILVLILYRPAGALKGSHSVQKYVSTPMQIYNYK